MAGGILSQIDWGGTFKFLGIRILFASIGLGIFFAVTGGPLGADMIFGLPIMVALVGGISLVTAWLSQVGVPFAGIVSMAFGIPFLLGDPMVWLLHQVRPNWVPVEEPGFFNPPMVWVLKG